jgi:hypothetical protein
MNYNQTWSLQTTQGIQYVFVMTMSHRNFKVYFNVIIINLL